MNITGGSTDVSTFFMVRLSATGVHATGLTIANFSMQYTRTGVAPAAHAHPTALAAADTAHTDNYAFEVDATNSPGLYRFDWPDAAFAAGVKQVALYVSCATAFSETQVVDIDPPVNVTNILGHLLTQTGTQLADGFQTFFDVASPTTHKAITGVALAADQAVNTTKFAGQTITCGAGVTVRADVGAAAAPGSANGMLIGGSNTATTFANLTVSGTSALGAVTATTVGASGAVTAASLTMSGALQAATIASTGTTTLNALTVTNNALVSGTTTHTGLVTHTGGTALGATTATTIAASGAVTAASLTMSGTLQAATIASTGATTLNSLVVSTTTTLTGVVTATAGIVANAITGTLATVTAVTGTVAANLTQILGTALTETSGLIAAAFKKFFNVAAPTATCLSLPDVVPGGTNGVFIAGTNAATTVTTALTTTFTGNLTGSVATVAANGITATSMAADAINAASVKADAVTKIQNGLATPTNITAGTIATVTNLTNAPTNGDFTAAMKSSITAAVPTVANVADGVWDEVLHTDHEVASSASVLLQASGTGADAATIANAVWDEVLHTDHEVASSASVLLQAAGTGADAATIADAVWNEVLHTDHEVASSASVLVQSIADDWANGGRLDLILDTIATDTTTDIPATITTMQGNVTDILADTNELELDWKNAGRLDAILDIIAADTTTDIPTLIGVAGAGLTAVPWNAAWDAEVQSEVQDAIGVATIAEMAQGIPPATPTAIQALMYLYMAWRNKTETTATLLKVTNDAGTAIAKATLSDDATTFTKDEFVSGA